MESIRVGHTVSLKRDIWRINNTRRDTENIYQYDLYARKGLTGEVVEVFKSGSSGNSRYWTHHAKVLSGGQIYTFRLTSLEKVPHD
jgi:hypothetical protein